MGREKKLTESIGNVGIGIFLLGDPQQREQPTKGAHLDAADALVHALGRDRATLVDTQGIILARTSRLRPHMCVFTSKHYCEGRLRSIDALERPRAADLIGRQE
jgi:uncharacterized protein